MSASRPSIRRRPNRGNEDGFTLIELLIALALSSVIAGVLVAAIATSLNVASSTTRLVNDSADAGLISAFLYRDAQAAGAINPSTAQTDAAAGVATVGSTAAWAGCAQTGTFVARFSWVDRRAGANSRTIVSTYALDAKNQLTRRLCQDGTTSDVILTHSLTSAVAVCTPDPACGALTASVTLNIEGSLGAAPFKYSLVGVLRAGQQTRPTAATSSAVPLIALGGSSGATPCPNLSLNAGQVKVIGDVVVGSACDTSPIKGFTTRLSASGPVRTLDGVVDPFLGLPSPVATCPSSGTNPATIGVSATADTTTVYPAAVVITGAVAFDPGRYVFCAGLSVGVGATVTGTGVFFFIPAGTMSVDAAAVVDLAAASTGTYANVLVWVATAQQVALNSGPQVSRYVGYIYAPTSQLSATGTGINSIGGAIAQGVSFGETTRARFGLPIPTINIAPLTVPVAQVGLTSAAIQLAASGGTAPYTWSASALPAGLVLDQATGVITGSPTASGSFTFIVTAVDATAAAGSRSYTLAVTPPLGVATPNAPDTGQVGVAYPATTLSATGGTAPFTWSAAGLPAGMVINQTTGVVTGTPTVAGASSVAFTVTDKLGATSTRSFPFSVKPALTLTARTMPSGQVGVAYPATAFAAAGGTVPYVWSATGLPAGLAINSSTGTITGTPTAPGSFNVVVRVNDSNTASATTSASLTIAPVLALATTALPSGQVGIAYAPTTLAPSGGTAPYTWSATNLPAGITLNATTGVLSGTPSALGTFAIVVTVVDSLQAASSANYSITISAAPSVTAPATLPIGQVGVRYPGATLGATGGTAPFRWSSTVLPAGLVLDAATGVISGSPTAGGSLPIKATVTDARGAVASRDYTLTVNAALAITAQTMPAGRVGVAYPTTTFVATYGTAPYTWSATGLPTGLAINASTGAITGTPTTAGSFNTVVKVNDANTASATQGNTVTITAVSAECPTNPIGWRGEYFKDITLAAPTVVCRDDLSLDFDWGGVAPATTMPTDMFSVRWTRTQNFSAGSYTFSMGSDDGARLYIDGALVLNRWNDQGYPSPVPTVAQQLSAGAHTIVMEYYERAGSARASLSWTPVTTQICPNAASAWQGQYYSNMTLSTPVTTCRDDASINFNWTSGAPISGMPVDNFSVRWTRTQTLDAGTYKFALGTDDGGRLYIDGVLVIDVWSDQSYPGTPPSANRTLTAGPHTIVVEYYERSGDARATFTMALV